MIQYCKSKIGYAESSKPDEAGQLANYLETCYHTMIMNQIDENLRKQINHLVDTYRDRCLWFLRADYYPNDLQDTLRTLDYIRRYGDREAFRKAGELYQWLSPDSSKPSAAS